VAGPDVLRIGVAGNPPNFSADALGRAVADLGLRVDSVDLDEHGVVHVAAEGILKGWDAQTDPLPLGAVASTASTFSGRLLRLPVGVLPPVALLGVHAWSRHAMHLDN
jgi:hypothetical protein